jgi:hypothetical protein
MIKVPRREGMAELLSVQGQGERASKLISLGAKINQKYRAVQTFVKKTSGTRQSIVIVDAMCAPENSRRPYAMIETWQQSSHP